MISFDVMNVEPGSLLEFEEKLTRAAAKKPENKNKWTQNQINFLGYQNMFVTLHSIIPATLPVRSAHPGRFSLLRGLSLCVTII